MTRLVTLLHRFLGILLSLFFAMWFLSGAVLIYHPFPSLSESERLAHSVDIDFSRIVISPLRAIESSEIQLPARLRLIDVDGQLAYIIHSHENTLKVIGGGTGKELTRVTQEGAKRIAGKFLAQAPAEVIGPLDYDQWIVHQRFDAYRPFYRIHFDDVQLTVLYVSMRTGEVLQQTRRSERAWNYIGAVAHWIYPTILRQHWALWDRLVWLLSLLGVITVGAGICVGVVRFRQARRSMRSRTSSPFLGWLRWHHLLGLISGVVVFTWILSGWLSMDHGRLFSDPDPTVKQIQDFQGISLKQVAEKMAVLSLQTIAVATELEFLAVGGQPLVLVKKMDAQLHSFTSDERSHGFDAFTLKKDLISQGVQHAWPGFGVQQMQEITVDDAYGHLREGSLPKGTLRIWFDDPGQTWVHVDMQTGRIVSVMDQSRRSYRWLFNGLHSLDFPGLVERRPLWDVLILSLLTLGFLFSLTGVVVGCKKVLQIWRCS